MTARLLACEARKLIRRKALLLVLLAAGAMTLLTIASPAEYPGGPMFMMAGERPSQVGGAIGFIGNLVDPHDVPGSAMRTAFLYTPFWVLVVILFAVNALSSDFDTGSATVTRAKGVSLGATMLAKVVVLIATVGLLYGLSCFSSFAFKLGQYGAALSGVECARFAGILIVNVFLLGSLVGQAALLVSATRSAFASAFVLVAVQVLVLLGYPSAYGSAGEAAAGPLFPLTPVFHLMHSCSLSFENVPLAVACGYALASSAAAMVAAAFALRVREV